MEVLLVTVMSHDPSPPAQDHKAHAWSLHSRHDAVNPDSSRRQAVSPLLPSSPPPKPKPPTFFSSPPPPRSELGLLTLLTPRTLCRWAERPFSCRRAIPGTSSQHSTTFSLSLFLSLLFSVFPPPCCLKRRVFAPGQRSTVGLEKYPSLAPLLLLSLSFSPALQKTCRAHLVFLAHHLICMRIL